MSPVDGQGELVLSRRAEPNEVPAEMIHRQKSAAAAFCLACQSSGLEDKEIYGALAIDAGYFSRIKKGEATLQADLIAPFCELVANRIYPEWLAYRIGCTLVQIKSESERRAEIAEHRRRRGREKAGVCRIPTSQGGRMTWTQEKERRFTEVATEVNTLTAERQAAIDRVRKVLDQIDLSDGATYQVVEDLIDRADAMRDALAPFDSGVRVEAA